MFNYFLPSTSTEYVFEVNQEATLNCRGDMLTISGPSNISYEFVDPSDFPCKVKFTVPGLYEIEQRLVSGRTVTESIYVCTADDHSNILLEIDELDSPIVQVNTETIDVDLIIWFAIALVALLFVEWILHTQDFKRR